MHDPQEGLPGPVDCGLLSAPQGCCLPLAQTGRPAARRAVFPDLPSGLGKEPWALDLAALVATVQEGDARTRSGFANIDALLPAEAYSALQSPNWHFLENNVRASAHFSPPKGPRHWWHSH